VGRSILTPAADDPLVTAFDAREGDGRRAEEEP
jgi:hypothetical protein